MHFLDWLIFSIPLLIVVCVGVYTHKHMKSVAHFLSGGRLAGRYLLAVAKGELQAGAVVFVALFEIISKAGFTLTWWGLLQAPAMIIVAISGFVIYRYRETRVLTLAQFFEVRYTKSFRVFTGGLAFVAGLLNFGIIPAVGARFFVYFLGLPPSITLFSYEVPTYIPLMGFFLLITVCIALSGGLITIMITDCVEGIFSQIFYIIIIAALLLMFSWSEISQVLVAQPPGKSFLNPFDTRAAEDFNLWYVLILIFINIYGTMAWQNAAGYNSAGLSAHETRMGGVLGRWRELGKMSVVTLLAICALTFLNHPDFSGASAAAHQTIAGISDAKVQSQMTVPIALSYLLPIGIKGMLCAILIMGLFGGDSTHLHSWSGIFVQDVLVPLRKKPFEPHQHIRLLRLTIIGVALFAFFFGCLFRQTEYIVIWWQITGAVYIGGAGAAIIGGLYWKKGTAAGAWAALISGATLSLSGIITRQIYGDDFPLNGMQISFFVIVIAIVLYVTVSLLTWREDFDMDKMLHRGRYAKKTEIAEASPSKPVAPPSFWTKLIGIDSDFTRGDRWIAGGLFGWSIFWSIVFVTGTLWNIIAPWPVSVWSQYWQIAGIGVPIIMTCIAGIWFTWGGIRDIRDFFRRLRLQKVNNLDDGTVVDHRNLEDFRKS